LTQDIVQWRALVETWGILGFYNRRDIFLLSSFLSTTAQLRPWPPPKNPAEFLGGFSTIFFLQGTVVSPTPNPHPRFVKLQWAFLPKCRYKKDDGFVISEQSVYFVTGEKEEE
jgi:hypothetical protein